MITDLAELYFKISLYEYKFFFLDDFHQKLNDRFLVQESILCNSLYLIKSNENNDTCFKTLLKTHAVDIDADDYLALGIFALWREQTKTKPIKTIVISLAGCNEQIYPKTVA